MHFELKFNIMSNLNRSNFQAHPFHLVSLSPWPLYCVLYTVILAIIFTALQGVEYSVSSFTISDGASIDTFLAPVAYNLQRELRGINRAFRSFNNRRFTRDSILDKYSAYRDCYPYLIDIRNSIAMDIRLRYNSILRSILNLYRESLINDHALQV